MRALYFLAAAPLALVSSAAFADQQTAYYGHPMWGGGWHGWFIGPIMMMLFLVIVIALVIFFMRRADTRPTIRDASQKSPSDILKERFARGEIDRTEFEERQKVLGD